MRFTGVAYITHHPETPKDLRKSLKEEKNSRYHLLGFQIPYLEWFRFQKPSYLVQFLFSVNRAARVEV